MGKCTRNVCTVIKIVTFLIFINTLCHIVVMYMVWCDVQYMRYFL